MSELQVVFTGDIAFSGYYKDCEESILLESNIYSFFNNANAVIANIEAPITSRKINSSRMLNHVNSLKVVSFLKKINSRIWNIGNNHIMDCGEEGLIDTIMCAKKNNATCIGANIGGISIKDCYTIVKSKGVSCGIISITQPFWALFDRDKKDVTLKWNNIDLVKEVIFSIREECDWIVLVVHGGEEFTDIPIVKVRRKYRELLSCGADLIIGHHPHVVQNYELIGKKAIFYSLGNFVFDTDYQRQHSHSDTGIVLKLNLAKDDWNWEAIATKMDRNTNKITIANLPCIFTNLANDEYKELWPYSSFQYIEAYHKVISYSDRKHSNCSKVRWFLRDLKKCTNKEWRRLLCGKMFLEIRLRSCKTIIQEYLVKDETM